MKLLLAQEITLARVPPINCWSLIQEKKNRKQKESTNEELKFTPSCTHGHEPRSQGQSTAWNVQELPEGGTALVPSSNLQQWPSLQQWMDLPDSSSFKLGLTYSTKWNDNQICQKGYLCFKFVRTWVLRCSSNAFNSSSKACSVPSFGSLLFKKLTKDGNIFDPLKYRRENNQFK